MSLSQNDRLIRIATPLGDDAFIVLSFSSTEEISDLFSFTLELASERNDITFEQLAGKNVTVSIKSSDGGERFFNGIIVGFSPMQVSEEKGYNKYKALMQPALWWLTRCTDCRVFQSKSVPDILDAVLGQAGLGAKSIRTRIDYRLALTGSYTPLEYCTQYNETDLNFISRICENEGIFYFFEHENGKHTLVFADSADKHKPHIAGQKETVRFQKTTSAHLSEEAIVALQQNKKLTVGRYAARDYNFIIPEADLTVTEKTWSASPPGQGEQYEYPGGYDKSADRGQHLAMIRMQSHDAGIHTLSGRSNCRGFSAGFKFKLGEHPLGALNGKSYVLTQVCHTALQSFTTGGGGDIYFNVFCCMPHEVPYRPRRKSRKPVISSSQTAIVTGPTKEEIHTDTYGRVKVQFFWDRREDQQGDGNMSCWIRVTQAWAGSRWGALFLPRVGQEVLVTFLDGDPDRPVINGCMYHSQNKQPFDLPAEKTKAAIMSNSTKDGQGGYNAITFEDRKDNEEFHTHAAKDRTELVENDKSTEVKNNQLIKVEQDRSLIVAQGNESVSIEGGGRSVSVKADEKHVNSADFNHKVSGSFTLKVNGNITIDASGIVKISGAKVILNG